MRATRLGSFIQQNIGAIVSEWEPFRDLRDRQRSGIEVMDSCEKQQGCQALSD